MKCILQLLFPLMKTNKYQLIHVTALVPVTDYYVSYNFAELRPEETSLTH